MAGSALAPRVLVVQGSRFGQSEKIAKAVCEVLQSRGMLTDLVALDRSTRPDPLVHTAFALVTSVRYGHFDKNAKRLLKRHRTWVDGVPTLLMTVSLTARTPEKRDPAVHVYTRKFLEQTAWQPTMVEVVAGALEYPRYNWFDRMMIRFIMRITGGETNPTANIEYTDWTQVTTAATTFTHHLRV
ncbi:MAG: menaquinone-dependent protoporphyrinogen IX dehydrogenase [Bifidobacteriaceae bacterium]|nr:menaquinone-dependent protoporphyrinogen IX dehydrogenase [Bifidobacteriaceae bacterium]